MNSVKSTLTVLEWVILLRRGLVSIGVDAFQLEHTSFVEDHSPLIVGGMHLILRRVYFIGAARGILSLDRRGGGSYFIGAGVYL